MSQTPLRILTLNTWGVPYAEAIPQRMTAIAAGIREINPDVILLQETFTERARQQLAAALSETWPYQHVFVTQALFSSGLMTVSRYPIVDADFRRYRARGKAEDIRHGDYYSGKGIGLTRLDTPSGLVDVYNAHTHAQYVPEDETDYALFNALNLYEALRFIDASAQNPVILGGDLNTRPDQLGYDLLRDLGGLADTYLTLNPDAEGFTYAAINPYTVEHDQRLDYLLVRHGAERGWLLKRADIVLTEAPPHPVPAYSDHYGVLLEADLCSLSSADDFAPPDPQQARLALNALHEWLERATLATLVESDAHQEQALLGSLGLLDVLFTGRLLRRRAPRLGRALQALTLVGTLSYIAYHALLGRVTVRGRQQMLQDFQHEIGHQLRAGRAFNGLRW